MTREKMWEEFESQLKKEVRTPITMNYYDSIRIAEMGIEDVVKRWKKRLEQEPKTGRWLDWTDDRNDYLKCSVCGYGEEGEVKFGEYTPYCPNCSAKMESEGKE